MQLAKEQIVEQIKGLAKGNYIDFSYTDFSGFDIDFSGLKANGINSMEQQSKSYIHIDFQQARSMFNRVLRAKKEIDNENQKVTKR